MATPVVLIHGMWSTGETLRPLRQRFEAAGYECVSPTLPNHSNGGNEVAVGTTSLLEYVDFLTSYIEDQRGSAPPLLVGHSMGGLLAQLLAARMPTAGLVLVAPASPPSGLPSVSWSMVRFFSPIFARPFWWKRAHRPRDFQRARSALFNNLPAPRQRELFDSLVPESGRVLFELALAPLDRSRAAAHDFSAVRTPALILQGTQDGVVPVAGVRRLANKYGSATLHEFKGSGHWLFEEPGTADSVFEDITRWLDSVEISPQRTRTLEP